MDAGGCRGVQWGCMGMQGVPVGMQEGEGGARGAGGCRGMQGVQGSARRCEGRKGMQGVQGGAGGCRGMQRNAGGCRGIQGDAGGCSGAKPAAAKADYSRPRQTIEDQAPVISAVLPASLMHFLVFTLNSIPLKLWSIICTKVLLHMPRIGNKNLTQNFSAKIKFLWSQSVTQIRQSLNAWSPFTFSEWLFNLKILKNRNSFFAKF